MKRSKPARRAPQLHRVVTALLCCTLFAGCKSSEPLQLRKNPKALKGKDRLEAKENVPGRERIFGIDVPKRMKVAARFDDRVLLSGSLPRREVVSYFRKHVLVEHVELIAESVVFPKVYIKGDKLKRLYRIEVTSIGSHTQVTMANITPVPPVGGISNQERWKRAGRKPDGSLLNRSQVF